MGEVYRATDTKLGRDVALKVLPAEMAGDPERLGRFQREARAVAALNHPHIVTLFSVEEADGVHFLTMELVEGQPLDRLIPASGLPVEQIIEIAGALADALSAAHEKGIMHRDLKPANVMVTEDGRVKVLDFGLAKDVRAESSSDATLTSAGHTQVGIVMGTPAYMSPEQISGRALDHRTDIFSLGVLLHEMCTGQRPFMGPSSAELTSAILRDTPPSITDTRSDLPSDLARVIRRCLEKDPRYRVQTARDVCNEFRDLARQSSRAVPIASSAVASRSVSAGDSASTRADEGFWVAVLPFRYSGSNADLTALAEGMTEDIVTGLSRFSYLRVIARSSTLRYGQESVDVRSAGKELGARYVMEGSLRQAGSRLRITVQLVDGSSGAHLWADTYDRPFRSESVFELQDEVVPQIVSTIADTAGVLPHNMGEALRNKPTDQLSPYEAVLRSFVYLQRVNPEEHAAAREGLERAVQQAPSYAPAWAMLAILIREEYNHGFNVRTDSLGRAFAAARAATEAAPSNHLAYHALASVLFFRRELRAFHSAAQRAVTLNPMDGYTAAYMGMLTAFAGDWDRGCALSQQARSLNPHHPGWYWFPPLFDAYRKGDYQGALDFALKINMPDFWRTNLALAAIYGQRGELEAARKAVRALLTLRPDFAATGREECSKWWAPELVEHLIDGLRKAGMVIPSEAGVALDTSQFSSKTASGAARAAVREDESFWVAVLPFRGATGDAEIEALADGLSEDVTTGLSRFPYLQVIAHNSAMAYKGRAADIRTVGRELGARYVIEGSIRKRGSVIRVSAQLMDAASGTQLWAEAYDREICHRESNDAGTFQIQDDLTDHIVTSVADGYGVLVRSMAAPTRDRKVEDLSASELVLRYYAFMQQVDPQEHAVLRAGFERALEREPNYAIAWACLSNLYVLEYGDGFNPQEKPMERAREAAWRAVKIDPACQMGWKVLAAVHFFSRDFTTFRDTAERAMALNPRDGTTLAYVGIMMAYSGDWERGVALVQRAIDLNRHHPGRYHNASFAHHYRKGEYEAALLAAKKINMPEYHWTHLATAAACGMLGRQEEARTAIESLRRYNPTFLDLENVREEIARWDPDEDEVERLLQGLQKAGLKYGSADSAGKTPFEPKIEPKLKSDPVATRGEATDSASTRVDHKDSSAVRADEGFWVAVLPFKFTGSAKELKALADGMSEEIITGLSRFSYLRVIARGSTAKYSSESGDVRAIGKELGARYVMEGSLRQAGTKLRLAVQLAETVSGAHLWAETYECAFTPESVFEVQDDLVPRIVSTIADQYGVLPRDMSQTLRNKSDDALTPHEAVLRTFRYFSHLVPEEHAAVRKILERAVRDAPDHADSWAMLSMMYRGEFAQGFNAGPTPLDRALAAAQRAVELAPTHALGHYALATVHFFRKETIPFRVAAERALKLNPLDASVKAYLGLLIAASGEWDRGCEMVESAMQLNPNCPGYFYFARCCNGYRLGKYAEVLEAVARMNMPSYFHVPALQAAALGQLGRHEEARKAVQDLLALRPDFGTVARQEYAKWYSTELIEQIIDGLRKAGLEIPDVARAESVPPTSSLNAPTSGETRAVSREVEGFWVAVLPFKYSGNNSDLTALAEGLTEDIITGMSRFPYLRVIAKSSTARYTHESGEVRVIGKELGARYVIEGNLRQAGTKLRIAVQFVDASSGANLWAETYEHSFSPETVFQIQDDLVPRIVSTIADAHGILPHSMGEAIRDKSPEQLSPYEAVLRSFIYAERITPEDHAAARTALERTVQLAPGYAYAWAMLSILYSDEHAQGFNSQPDPLGRALQTARKAVDLEPSNHRAFHALATVLFHRKEIQAFRTAAERTIALNPMDGCSIAHMGALLAYTGDWDHGCALVEQAVRLNPHHPGWYWFPLFFSAYRKGDYRGALSFALKINLPGFSGTHSALAATYGQLGELDAAGKALRELLTLVPNFAAIARPALTQKMWFDPEIVERLLDGLRKAGLEIAGEQGTVPTKPKA
jgi:TolB-like protein/Tfp pilus assembly protein PilF